MLLHFACFFYFRPRDYAITDVVASHYIYTAPITNDNCKNKDAWWAMLRHVIYVVILPF